MDPKAVYFRLWGDGGAFMMMVLFWLFHHSSTTVMVIWTTTLLRSRSSWSVQALSSRFNAAASRPSPRHVCLLDSYPAVQGPYFSALLDQLVERAAAKEASATGAVRRGEEEERDEDSLLRMVFCYSQTDADAYSSFLLSSSSSSMDDHDISAHVQRIQDDLREIRQSSTLITTTGDGAGAVSCHVAVLEDYNPLTLEEQFQEWGEPNIIWVWGSNAFGLRYKLRTSGLDRWIHRHCAGGGASSSSSSSSSRRRHNGRNKKCCVYVGEGAGALCAGASLRVAHYYDHPSSSSSSSSSLLLGPNKQDPKAAPEPQFFGLGLLGPDRTVAFTTATRTRTTNGKSEEIQENSLRSRHPDLAASKLRLLQHDQVYVWSQSSSNPHTSAGMSTNDDDGDGGDDDDDDDDYSVASFVFLAAQRGMMEQMSSPDPLPPLVVLMEDDDDDNDDESFLAKYRKQEGVDCYGEPSIDPSRQMQSIGDSEWFEEEGGGEE